MEWLKAKPEVGRNVSESIPVVAPAQVPVEAVSNVWWKMIQPNTDLTGTVIVLVGIDKLIVLVDDFQVIWKPICDFLLVINNSLNSTLHRLAAIARNAFNVIQGQWFPFRLTERMAFLRSDY